MDYFKNRHEKTIIYNYACYRLHVRYFADSNKAQVSMYDISCLRFPLLWSEIITDKQAAACIDIFKTIGYFDIFDMIA